MASSNHELAIELASTVYDDAIVWAGAVGNWDTVLGDAFDQAYIDVIGILGDNAAYPDRQKALEAARLASTAFSRVSSQIGTANWQTRMDQAFAKAFEKIYAKL